MTLPFTIAENYKIVDASGGPVTTNGAVTFDYISMKHAHKVWIMMQFTQAVAHQTIITPTMATAVAPTGATAITAVQNIWSNLDTAAGDTLVKRTAALTYTLPATAKKMLVIFEIDPSVIIAAGKTYDVLGCGLSASNQVTDFVSALYIIAPRYQQATPPTAITD